MNEVNALGKICPLPIIDIALAVKSADKGTVFTLRSDDPATWADLQAWGRMTDHHVLRIDETSFEVTA